MPRIAQIVVGLLVVAAGVGLAFSPLAVASALHRPHETPSQMINLRASWGGSLVGLGAFTVWVQALQPWRHSGLGLVMWLMIGIGLARVLGFALDGRPDTLQWVWITAEVLIALACGLCLSTRWATGT